MSACFTDTGHHPIVDSVFGKEWSMDMWRHEESNVCQHENEHVVSLVNTTEVGLSTVDMQALIKQINDLIQFTDPLLCFSVSKFAA